MFLQNLVNHNQTRANVKLKWSDPQRSNHVPELLDTTIEEFAKDRTARLAMDLVATRPIAEALPVAAVGRGVADGGDVLRGDAEADERGDGDAFGARRAGLPDRVGGDLGRGSGLDC